MRDESSCFDSRIGLIAGRRSTNVFAGNPAKPVRENQTQIEQSIGSTTMGLQNAISD
jgi:hypothetical protein